MRLYYLFTDTTVMRSTYLYARSIFISEGLEWPLYMRGLGGDSKILMYKRRGKPLRVKMVLQ